MFLVPYDLPIFPPEEYARRVSAARASMSQRGLDGCVVSSPENIYYLTGLDHMGYFAFQALVLPASGEPVLVTRRMEQATVRDQVPHLKHVGYSDGVEPPPDATGCDDIVLHTRTQDGRVAGLRPGDTSYGRPVRESNVPVGEVSAPVEGTVQALEEAGLLRGTLGMEYATTFLPYKIVSGIKAAVADVEWVDCSGVVDDLRVVQSPLEQIRTRRAAEVSDSMMLAAIASAGVDQNSHDVMAAIYDTMFRRGGTYPGFVPLVRTTRTLAHEHGTWQGHKLRKGDVLFLEMAGCVRRYHAPLGRLVFVDHAPKRAEDVLKICRESMERAAEQIRPGALAKDVYHAWQSRLDAAGLDGYRRHHCGYSVGIGYPPSWSGSGVPVGLRPSSSMQLQAGMVFHLMSWLLRTGKGDSFLSDTVLVTETGCEWLTNVGREIYVR
ncbi:MAG: Xaa-Pro peptidase family protein [Myxococcota bacterium]|nr:Xaa-Pro peptidase family protein [Myxococcota bacterium]